MVLDNFWFQTVELAKGGNYNRRITRNRELGIATFENDRARLVRIQANFVVPGQGVRFLKGEANDRGPLSVIEQVNPKSGDPGLWGHRADPGSNGLVRKGTTEVGRSLGVGVLKGARRDRSRLGRGIRTQYRGEEGQDG